MLAYVLTAAVSFICGCVARHFVQAEFVPLSADAKQILLKYTPLKEGELSADAQDILAKVVAHIDSMKDKSEIMIRHDAGLLRNALMGK
jgi:hypothetical protein